MVYVVNHEHAVLARIRIERSGCTLHPEQSKTQIGRARRDGCFEPTRIGRRAEVTGETKFHALSATMGVQKGDTVARVTRSSR